MLLRLMRFFFFFNCSMLGKVTFLWGTFSKSYVGFPAPPSSPHAPRCCGWRAVLGKESPSPHHSLDLSLHEAKARVQWNFSFLVNSDQAVLANPGLLVN